MGLGSFLFGSKDKMGSRSMLTPEQEQYLRQLLGEAGQFLPGIGEYLNKILSDDPDLMGQFEQPYLREFNEQIVPGIAERFTQGGAQHSSGFNQAMGQAGQSLAEKLAQMRAQLKQSAIDSALGMGQTGLGRQAIENYMQKGSGGFLGPVLGGLAGGFGGGLGGAIPGIVSGWFKRGQGGGMQ